MILAVDGGLRTLGWAIVEPRTGRVVDLGARISPARDRGGRNADRITRLDAHARELHVIARLHNVERVVAEAISLPRRGGINVHASAFLAWGALVGLAVGLGLQAPAAIAPASWQRAVVPSEEERKRDGYAAVERALTRYIASQPSAHASLGLIAASHRNHALDAVGVGICAAVRPDLLLGGSKKRRAR